MFDYRKISYFLIFEEFNQSSKSKRTWKFFFINFIHQNALFFAYCVLSIILTLYSIRNSTYTFFLSILDEINLVSCVNADFKSINDTSATDCSVKVFNYLPTDGHGVNEYKVINSTCDVSEEFCN